MKKIALLTVVILVVTTVGRTQGCVAIRNVAGISPDLLIENVKPGDKWNGATTATGGCTGATFNFKEVKSVKGKDLAYFDVTNIMFINPADNQVGPMKMVVDLSTGLPTLVDYKVKNSKSGVTSHIREMAI